MGSIPRVGFDELPASGVPHGPIPEQGGAHAIAELSGVVEKAAQFQASNERYHAIQLRRAQEAKDAVTNAIDAGKRASDFEENLRDGMTAVQKQFADNPQDAPAVFLDMARAGADMAVHAAPNAEIQLALAHKTQGRIDASMSQMHQWVEDRRTQKAKADLSVMVNNATAGAENLSSSGALTAYLGAKEKELSPFFDSIHGADAAKKMAELKTDATRAWVLSLSDNNPVAALQELDAPKGPLVDYLDTKMRESLRKDADSSFKGFGKVRQLEIIKKGIDQNRDIYAAFQKGELDAGTIFSTQRALNEERKATEIDPKYSPEQKKEQIEQLDQRQKFLGAIDQARRAQLSFDAEDENGTVTKLIQDQDALFKQDKGKGGKDLSAWLKHQTDLAQSFGDKKISQSTFNTMFKAAALALPKALDAEANNTGWNFGLFTWRNPRQTGNAELDSRLDTAEFKELSPAKKNAVRMSYIDQLNEASDHGQTVSAETARNMALKALALETGRRIPGVK